LADRTIRVDYLARVEGEGALNVLFRDGRLEDVQLRIFEPPRFFEALLVGRSYTEAPDITARICGICPVAYQMSAVHALERALRVELPPELVRLRRLLYCGEWIESHTLHIYMLHAPDFLGYTDGIAMARDHPDVVRRGLRLKKAGNEILRVVGGRSVHPVNVKVGGFFRLPDASELESLRSELEWAREAAAETVKWAATLPFPDFERDYEYVALRHEAEYPMNRGRIVSNRGLDIDADDYEQQFVEEQVPHSTALHSRLRDRGHYLVGPLARYNLNSDQLSDVARAAALEAGLGDTCLNPFRSIIVRAVEVLYACDEALRILGEPVSADSPPALSLPNASGKGCAATEAPRGILYHAYAFEDDGRISRARIVPPTSQNQPTIEDDLRSLLERYSDLEDTSLQLKCEQTIRNHDPCISCATHFLDMTVRREGMSPTT